MPNLERNQMRAPNKARQTAPGAVGRDGGGDGTAGISAQLAKLAAMDLKNLSRPMKELRALLFLPDPPHAASQAKNGSRRACSICALISAAGGELEAQLIGYDFEDPFEHLTEEFDKLKNIPPANREKKADERALLRRKRERAEMSPERTQGCGQTEARPEAR